MATPPRGQRLFQTLRRACATLLLAAGAIVAGPASWTAPSARESLHLKVVAAPYEPFAFPVGDQAKGLDVELLNLVCSARGWTYDIEWVPFTQVLARIEAGTADLAIGAIYVTEERRRSVLFTDPYLHSGLVLVTRADRPVRSPGALEGLRVGVKRGSTGEALSRETRDRKHIPLVAVAFDTTESSFEALRAHQVDAVLNDYFNSIFLIHNRYSGEMVIAQGTLGPYFFDRNDLAFPMRASLTAQRLAFNETLRQLRRGGVTGQIVGRWLPEQTPVDWERMVLIAGGLLLFAGFHAMLFFVYYRRSLKLKVLSDSEKHYRELIERSPLAIFIQREGTIVFANGSFLSLLGLQSVDRVKGRSVVGFFAEEERDRVARFVTDRSAGRPAPDTCRTVALRPDGTTFPARVKVATVTMPDGPGYLVFLEDFSEHARAEEALKTSEERFRALAENTSAAIFIYQENRFRYVNPATEQISGYSHDELLSMNFWDLVHPDHREMVKARGLARQAGESVLQRYEFKVLCKGGEERWVQFSAGLTMLDGRPAALGTAFDITERKRAESRLEHLAHYDFLTGLPNRILYYERLGNALAQAKADSKILGVVILDLDRFKDVNDTLGHDVGDLVLQGISRRLASCAGERSTVARLGSDEFSLLLPDLEGEAEAEAVARHIISELSRPFTVAGHEVHVSPSLGLCIYPADGDDVETLLKNADIALLRARSHGGRGYQFVTSDLSAQAAEQTGLKNRLRKAIERQEFKTLFQPILSLSDQRVVTMETLVRWDHPELGFLSPYRFIPLAEETGLILPLGEWVLYAACAQNVAWQRAGLAPVRVSVNLSARQFQQRDLIETVDLVLSSTGLEPQYLELEITESTAMADMDNTVAMLQRLSELGISIAIDDFGTGYSSLAYLKKFPIQQLKIDHSFVRDVPEDADDSAIVRAVVTMAHGLGLRVTAEGVENERQLAFLREVGCDAVQGYYFREPATATEVEVFLRRP